MDTIDSRDLSRNENFEILVFLNDLNHLCLDKLYVSDILEDAEVLERGRIPVDWEEDGDAALLGNDFVFCTAFVTSFLFNWVGFLLLMCFCHTIAAR